MNRSLRYGVSVAVLALATQSGAASAETTTTRAPTHPTSFRGMVQNLGPGSFRLNSNGTLTTVTFTNSTRVNVVVSGSTADLTKGVHVTLQFGSNGSTVRGIKISPTFTGGPKIPRGATGGSRSTSTHTGKSTPGTSGQGGQKSGTDSTKPLHGSKGPPARVTGQVVSFTSFTGVLKIVRANGQASAYTIPDNVTVTKIVAASTGSLANGEMVQGNALNGAATFISILSA